MTLLFLAYNVFSVLLPSFAPQVLFNLNLSLVHSETPDPPSVSLMQAMWLMLQQDKPEDFVIATHEAHSIREFVEAAFKHVGVDIV